MKTKKKMMSKTAIKIFAIQIMENVNLSAVIFVLSF